SRAGSGCPESGLIRGADAMSCWSALAQCRRLCERRIRHGLKRDFATTLPQYLLMRELNRVPAGLTMSVVSRRLGVAKSNVTGIVARLSERGFLRRDVPCHDRRAAILRLSGKGVRL